MTIRVLVIDDELGRLDYRRKEFLRRWAVTAADDRATPVVDYTFVTAQRVLPDRIDNDAQVAVDYVAVDPERWALVLLDMQFDHGPLSDGEPPYADNRYGLVVQRELEASFPGLPIVQFTAQAQVELPDQNGRYLSKIDGTVDDLRLALVTVGRLSTPEKAMLLRIPSGTVVNSAATVELYASVLQRARADVPLLIRGPTGSGKEHVARYFHCSSGQHAGPFMALQVSSIPASLYESELFGHEKGAFSGAERARPGAFELAAGGTLFLDEIGSLTPELQAKLLRVIGARQFRRLGGATDITVQCGIVAATQDDLEATGFRKDLLARFRTVRVPSLSDRREEIPALADYFLRAAEKAHGKRQMVFSQEALLLLTSLPLDGNARDLQHAIDHAVMQLSSHSVIQPQHLRDRPEGGLPVQSGDDAPRSLIADTQIAPSTHLRDAIAKLEVAHVPRSPQGLKAVLKDLDSAMASVRARLAGAALAACRHPVTGKIKVQPAMQLLAGDPDMTAANAKRLLNALLGRAQNLPLDMNHLHRLADDAGRDEGA